jgi:uncharacterized LabA/DUF88 family protein
MATDAVADLAISPDAQVIVFIDGQNLYKTCLELFGHPLCHPHLLAEYVAGPRTKRVSCRFYTGRPDPHRPAERDKARNSDRRLDLICRNGATKITRPLRYHWDWGHRQTLPQPEEGAPEQTVRLHPWERPHEKGIDVLIALDVIEFIVMGVCDVAVVVSLDRDLREIPAALRNLSKAIDRPYRLEAAVPVEFDDGQPKRLQGFSYTHQITPSVFDLIRDDTDYTASAAQWVVPTLPANLDEVRASREATQAAAAEPPGTLQTDA